PTGAHLAPRALARKVLSRRNKFGGHVLPAALELLGDELSKTGLGALPHLRSRNAYHAGVVGVDQYPGSDLADAVGSRVRLGRCHDNRKLKPERETNAYGR